MKWKITININNHFRIYKDIYLRIHKAVWCGVFKNFYWSIVALQCCVSFCCMYDVVFNNTTLRLCRRGHSPGPHSSSCRGPGTRWTYPSRASIPQSGFRLHSESPEFPDQIPGHFQGMNRLLSGLASQRGALPLVGARGIVRGWQRVWTDWTCKWTRCPLPHWTYHRWSTKGSRSWPRGRFSQPALSSGKSENSKFKPSFPGHYEDIFAKAGG